MTADTDDIIGELYTMSQDSLFFWLDGILTTWNFLLNKRVIPLWALNLAPVFCDLIYPPRQIGLSVWTMPVWNSTSEADMMIDSSEPDFFLRIIAATQALHGLRNAECWYSSSSYSEPYHFVHFSSSDNEVEEGIAASMFSAKDVELRDEHLGQPVLHSSFNLPINEGFLQDCRLCNGHLIATWNASSGYEVLVLSLPPDPRLGSLKSYVSMRLP